MEHDLLQFITTIPMLTNVRSDIHGARLPCFQQRAEIFSFTTRGGGALECQGGYQARPKIHVIRVVFRTRHSTRVHRLGVQKRAKLKKKKKKCVFGQKDKFWKGLDGQINT